MTITVPAHAKRVELIAEVIRCTCAADAQRSQHAGQPCPQGRRGEVRRLYWHRNPLKRLIFKLTGKAL